MRGFTTIIIIVTLPSQENNFQDNSYSSVKGSFVAQLGTPVWKRQLAASRVAKTQLVFKRAFQSFNQKKTRTKNDIAIIVRWSTLAVLLQSNYGLTIIHVPTMHTTHFIRLFILCMNWSLRYIFLIEVTESRQTWLHCSYSRTIRVLWSVVFARVTAGDGGCRWGPREAPGTTSH